MDKTRVRIFLRLKMNEINSFFREGLSLLWPFLLIASALAFGWVVDEGGELVNDKGCSEVNHHPSSDDYYVCSVCGEKAKVVKVE